MTIEDSDRSPQDLTNEEGMTEVDVWTACTSNGIMLSKDQLDTLIRFHDELIYWNARVNLISRKDESHIWDRHILHSLMILKYVNIGERARVLDVGTGGGLPGIPLKIARPDIKMTLVDSIKKKLSLAEMFAQHTGLKDIEAICSRAEDLVAKPHYRTHFNVIVSRAVAPLSDVIRWTKPLATNNCIWALLKGGNLSNEIRVASSEFNSSEQRAAGREFLVEEKLIDAFGMPQFAKDEKKIVICRFS